MEARTERWKRWGMVVCGMTLGLAEVGCSTLIANSGIAGVQELRLLATRAAVRDQLGFASSAESRADGTSVERYHIRRRVTQLVDGFGGDLRTFFLTYGLVEVIGTPVALYQSEKARLHVAFVFGADDHVLCHYREDAPPATRFDEATLPLAASLWMQLEGDACPSWRACLGAFVEQVRQRAACVGYPVTPTAEASLGRLFALAKDVDAGRIPKEEALAETQDCLACSDALASCPPPAPSGSDSSLTEGPDQLKSLPGPG